jgi:hypothetical protein
VSSLSGGPAIEGTVGVLSDELVTEAKHAVSVLYPAETKPVNGINGALGTCG